MTYNNNLYMGSLNISIILCGCEKGNSQNDYERHQNVTEKQTDEKDEDAKAYLEFLEHGSTAGLTDAELLGIQKLMIIWR